MSTMRDSMGFRSVAAVTRGLDCPCCKDRRTKREIRRTARRVDRRQAQRDAAAELTRMRAEEGA